MWSAVAAEYDRSDTFRPVDIPCVLRSMVPKTLRSRRVLNHYLRADLDTHQPRPEHHASAAANRRGYPATIAASPVTGSHPRSARRLFAKSVWPGYRSSKSRLRTSKPSSSPCEFTAFNTSRHEAVRDMESGQYRVASKPSLGRPSQGPHRNHARTCSPLLKSTALDLTHLSNSWTTGPRRMQDDCYLSWAMLARGAQPDPREDRRV